jgi:hypothetical protein
MQEVFGTRYVQLRGWFYPASLKIALRHRTLFGPLALWDQEHEGFGATRRRVGARFDMLLTGSSGARTPVTVISRSHLSCRASYSASRDAPGQDSQLESGK